MRNITYAVDYEGHVVSRVGSEIASPVIQYADMNPENSFEITYKLEKFNVFDFSPVWDNYKWTKKIPVRIKNAHRKFWGMKPLKEKEVTQDV